MSSLEKMVDTYRNHLRLANPNEDHSSTAWQEWALARENGYRDGLSQWNATNGFGADYGWVDDGVAPSEPERET